MSSGVQTNIENSSSMNYNFEEKRFESYEKWPAHSPVDPVRLSKAGFYYSGSGDEVICFSCKGHIKNWNYGDIVLKKHCEFFPFCDFVNKKSENVPMTEWKNKCVKTVQNSAVDSPKSSQNTDKFDYTILKSYQERLKTFNGLQPKIFVDSKTLAEAGFFYFGTEDKVQCAFCRGIVSKWNPSDDPQQEHIKHFPWCDFANRFRRSKMCVPYYEKGDTDICGNMTMHESPNVGAKLLDGSEQHKTLKNLGVRLHNPPFHIRQANLSARLRSFISWPTTCPVSKEELAQAGFFYIGIGDHTKCFHCNGGLCNWELDDDPWVEHAKWFCNCDFLRFTKGEDFVESCLREYNIQILKIECPDDPFPIFPTSDSLLLKVDESMSSPCVKSVLDVGLFPSYLVRAAVLCQIKETGQSFSTLDELCFAVSHLKGTMEKKPLNIINDFPLQVEFLGIDLSKCAISVSGEHEDTITAQISTSVKEHNSIAERPLKNKEEVLVRSHCFCKICMDKEVSVLFLPCGHLLACNECASSLQLCPMCRDVIQATVKAYLP